MDSTRRVLAVLIAGLLASGIGAVFVHQSAPATADAPLPRTVAAPVTAPPTTAPAPPAPAPAVARPARPVDAPANAYAPEPVVRIGTIEIPKLGLVRPIMPRISMR